jgi:hypothetical protein
MAIAIGGDANKREVCSWQILLQKSVAAAREA